MKTTQIIDNLSIKETKQFKIVINTSTKKSVVKLFQFLSKQTNKKLREDKTKLYQFVFGTNYSSAKDYLLRNELRLLNQLLEKFIAEQRLDLRDRRYLFLQSIQERGLDDLFEKEIKKEIKKSTENQDHENLTRLQELVLQRNVKSRAITKENLQRDVELCDVIDYERAKAQLYGKGEIEIIKAYLIKNLRNIGAEIVFQIQDDISEVYDDAYLSYLKNKAKGFVNNGKEKLDNLSTALQLLNKINYFKLDKEQAKVSTLNNLALEYLIAHDYENAVLAFEQMIESKNLTSQTKPYVLFNYLTCLLKSRQYLKAIDLIELHFPDDLSIPMLTGKISSIKAMAWIYVGDLKKAYEELPLNLKEGSRADYFYSRLVLTIIYYLENNQDLAHREVENILQINRENPQSEELIFCAKAFKKFLASEHKLKKRLALFTTIETFVQTDGHGSDVLPLLWLRDYLNKEVGN